MADEQASIQLSRRELQVLELIVNGASNQEIANQLVISINTVKVHVRNIFGKLDVQSRTEASLRAIQEGLITVTEDEAELDPSEAVTQKSFLLDVDPPKALSQWQRIYLLAAGAVALLMAFLPLYQPQVRQVDTKIPVVFRAQATATPATVASKGRWTPHAAIPGERAGLALLGFERNLFAIGGVRENQRATRSVEIFDTTTNTWTEGASKPTAAANVTGVLLNNEIYVPGGCTNDGTAISAFEIYAPETDTWRTGPDLPAPRCAYGLAAMNDTLYLFGGWDGGTFAKTIFSYHPQANSWTELEAELPAPLGYMGAAALNETIYIVGGFNGETEVDTTYAFTPDTETWTPKASLTEKRGGLGLISTGQALYAVGGGWSGSLTSSEKYDPETNEWSAFETPFQSQWRNLGLTTVDSAIYAVGGWDGDEQEFMDTVVSYQVTFQTFLPLSITR